MNKEERKQTLELMQNIGIKPEDSEKYLKRAHSFWGVLLGKAIGLEFIFEDYNKNKLKKDAKSKIEKLLGDKDVTISPEEYPKEPVPFLYPENFVPREYFADPND